jgi:crossover junction endodeoxyribonuclease RuvC
MAVIGIDPGTAITGFAIVVQSSDGGLTTPAYGVIRTEKILRPEERLAELYARLCEILTEYRPEHGAVERLFFQQNVRTAFAVGEARGVILLALAQADIPAFEYNPMEVKQAVAGYGHADKRQVQEMTRALLRLEHVPSPDDAADALAVAICHIHSHRIRGLA